MTGRQQTYKGQTANRQQTFNRQMTYRQPKDRQ